MLYFRRVETAFLKEGIALDCLWLAINVIIDFVHFDGEARVSLPNLHPWTLNPHQAVKIQAELRDRLVLSWDGREVTTVGGVDVGLEDDQARASIVVLRYPDLAPVEGVTAEAAIVFPYIPGLLAFREGPAVLAAWKQLRTKPDLLMFDAQGIAHPRGIGLASQMGLWLERPSIGVAKSRLYGHHAVPGPKRGDGAELWDERDPDRIIGMVLRTRADVNPVYVSIGHLIDLPRSVEFVLKCCTRYRLPEPTRWAHKVAGGERLPTEVGQQARLF
ncbi:MAG: deoxyribonuclease V [Gemmatimonadota bacterium]